MLPNRFRMLALAAAIASITSLAHAQAGSASKWWWETYNGSGNVNLKSPGTVSATRNPTGDAAQPATTAATQPPTVIIQTQSTGGTAAAGMTCVDVSATIDNYNYNYPSINVSPASCPSVSGYSVFPITAQVNAGGYSVMHTTNQTLSTKTLSGAIITACCYTASASSIAGAAYSPWQDHNTSGYSGSQRQEWKNPGNSSFTVPQGVYKVWVSVVGGGGAGGPGLNNKAKNYNYWVGRGGGGGGVIYRFPLNVLPGAQLGIYVGGGGQQTTGGAGFTTGGSGFPDSATWIEVPTGGGGGSSAVTYQQIRIVAAGGSGGSGYSSSGYYYLGGQGGGAAGPGQAGHQSSSTNSGNGYTASSGTGPASSGNNCPGGANGVGGFSSGGGFGAGGGGHYLYAGCGGGFSVVSNATVVTGAYGTGGADGGKEDNAYGGVNGFTPGSGGARSATTNVSYGSGQIYGGGGGAGGFLGMEWTTGTPYGGNGSYCNNGAPVADQGGKGGFGFGAGGGGASGYTNTASLCPGGNGANGYVAIEW